MSPYAEVKDMVEILAIAAAAIFFAYKVLSGWLFVNVAICIDLDRKQVPNDPSMEYLAIMLNIEKKQTGSVILKNVRARVTSINGKEEFALINLEGIEKLKYEQEPSSWGLHEEGLKQRLTPGTTTQLSGLARVPKEKPVLVDVSMISRGDFHISDNQIRATKISLPG